MVSEEPASGAAGVSGSGSRGSGGREWPGSQGLVAGDQGGRGLGSQGLVSRGAEAVGPGRRERPSSRKQPPRLPQGGRRLRTGSAGPTEA